MRREKELWFLLLIAASVRMILFFRSFFPWWDFGVYLGMGKFIYSLGASGLWEPIRPVLWPGIIGLFWKAGLDPIAWTRGLTFFLSLGITVLVYLIAKHAFNRRAAIISAIIITFSSIFLFMSTRLYTGIPAVFLVLLALYSLIRKRHLLAGLFLGLAAMTRFTAGIFIVVFLFFFGRRLMHIFSSGSVKKEVMMYFLGFFISVFPYLISNLWAYGGFFFPFIEAQRLISSVLSCNVLHKEGLMFFPSMLVRDSPLFLFAFPGFYFLWKSRDRMKILVAAAFLLPFLYHLQMGCRIDRYALLFIPFLAMIAGYGLDQVFVRLRSSVIFFIVLLVSAGVGIMSFPVGNISNDASREYLKVQPKGEVWTSNPLVSIYTDSRLNLIYYPVYDGKLSGKFLNILERRGIGTVYMDNCGGGIICPPGDGACETNLASTMDLLEKDYLLDYDASYGRCYYKVFIS